MATKGAQLPTLRIVVIVYLKKYVKKNRFIRSKEGMHCITLNPEMENLLCRYDTFPCPDECDSMKLIYQLL